MEQNLKRFFVCSCFYTNNFYLKQVNCHIVYRNRGQFLSQYDKLLLENGIKEDAEIDEVIREIEKELKRRKRLGEDFIERKYVIEAGYRRLYPDIFSLQEKFLAQEFLNLVKYCKRDDADYDGVLQLVQETNADRVFVFPVFTPAFCEKFLEELQNFEASDYPKGRPNTMNNYGINLDELGFDEFITDLREKYIQPISQKLFLDWGGGRLDSHKAFTVKYRVGDDLDLSYHYDNAEVTLNVALSPKDSYTGGALYFGDMRNKRCDDKEYKLYEHTPQFGILHRGQHMHGARPIESGERVNLIIWMRASSVRNRLCPMCDRRPTLVDSVGKGDGFTLETRTVNVCQVT